MFTLVVKRLFLAVTPLLLALVQSNPCQGQQPANQNAGRLSSPCQVKVPQAGSTCRRPNPLRPRSSSR